MTRPMYEALRALYGLPAKQQGFESVMLAGVLIMPDDCDYIEDVKAAEKRGWAQAMDFIQSAKKLVDGAKF